MTNNNMDPEIEKIKEAEWVKRSVVELFTPEGDFQLDVWTGELEQQYA